MHVRHYCHRRRGGIAVITLLFVAGAALTVALTAHLSAVTSLRSARDRHLSDRAFAAAESGAVDGVRRLVREQGLVALPSVVVDGMTVSRAVSTTSDVRTVTATAQAGSVTATVVSTCGISSGTCTVRRQ